MYKNEEIVDLLLDHKADVNVQDEVSTHSQKRAPPARGGSLLRAAHG